MNNLFVFFLFHVLLSTCSSSTGKDCSPSSCGKILNISHPFRLKSDPQGCGDYRYELSCENNSTVLYLGEGKFSVEAINYDMKRIRVVDPGVDKDDCSSLPRFPLSYYNLSNPPVRVPFTIHPVVPMEIVKCVEPVNSTIYLNGTSCFHEQSAELVYRYAYVGRMDGYSLRKGCSIEAMTLLHSSDDPMSSYIEVHRRMAFGTELLWSYYSCSSICSSGDCYIDITGHVECRFKPGIFIVVKYSLIFYAVGFGYALADVCRYIYAFFGSHFNIEKLHLEIQDDYPSYRNYCWPYNLSCYWPFHTLALLVIYAAARSLFGTPFVITFLIYKWRRRHLSGYDTIEEFLQGQNNLMPIRYAYSDVKKMTGNFGEMLGKGGFGSVYKGKLRSGQFAAIKMLQNSKSNGQDFMNEVATIGRIHHANVVRLIGFCFERSKHALVYEFMSNGSLDSHIFSPERSLSLSWQKLYEISLGVARGIEYLHQGCDIQILHFDIKPHNILLDENFAPKISDFGLAKLYQKTDSITSLTAARGTIGYMAPELFYKNIGHVSYKADVYSFGMLLLEMAGKRKNFKAPAVDAPEENLSQIYYPFWVYDKLSDGNLEIEDTTDEENEIVRKMIITGLWCIQMKPSTRPSMNKVVEMLEGDLEGLQLPPKPVLYPAESMQKDGEQSTIEFSESSSSLSNNPI